MVAPHVQNPRPTERLLTPGFWLLAPILELLDLLVLLVLLELLLLSPPPNDSGAWPALLRSSRVSPESDHSLLWPVRAPNL